MLVVVGAVVVVVVVGGNVVVVVGGNVVVVEGVTVVAGADDDVVSVSVDVQAPASRKRARTVAEVVRFGIGAAG